MWGATKVELGEKETSKIIQKLLDYKLYSYRHKETAVLLYQYQNKKKNMTRFTRKGGHSAITK